MFEFSVDKHLFSLYNANIEQMFRTYGRTERMKKVKSMRKHRNLQEMSDRELRHYGRVLRLRRERRRKIVTAFFTVFATICMIMVCVISYSTIRSNASSGFKYYTQVTVEAGENLWDIAEEYIDYDYYKDKNSYISEVRSINHLDTDGNIVAGQSLILPYYSAEFVY